MVGEFRQKSHQRTSHKIDGQSAEGKLDTLAQLLGIPAHKVPQDGPDEAAGAYEKDGAQGMTR